MSYWANGYWADGYWVFGYWPEVQAETVQLCADIDGHSVLSARGTGSPVLESEVQGSSVLTARGQGKQCP